MNANIAIVDDEESVRRALGRLLRIAGMQVETFATGLDFLNALAMRHMDCVVLDLHMPGLTGFDVQSRLRQSGRELPVIILTAHDTTESRARALANGAAAYLVKPVDTDELLAAITSVVID